MLADLGHLAEASGVAIELDADRVEVDPALSQMARGLGVDARSWVFGGGEDHALAACFPGETVLSDRWTVIGTVRGGGGLDVRGWDPLPVWWTEPGSAGYEHFAR